MAEAISKRYGLKVVLSQVPKYRCTIKRWNNFEIRADVGPKQFLNLCKYAKLVCCDSFHAVVFSILLQKPFIVFNGMEDSRIADLLNLTGLQSRNIESINEIKGSLFEVDFSQSLVNISLNSDKSISYLKSVLEV